MAHVKTAVSLPAPLFKKAETLARKLKLSRSRLFALALQEFDRRVQAREMLETLNSVYEEGPEDAESQIEEVMRRRARRRLEGEW